MNFKRILLPVLMLGTLTLSAQKHHNVTISGTLSNTGSYTKIYLDSLGLKTAGAIDTSSFGENGSFSFSARIPATNLYRIRLDDKNFITLILSPGEKVKVSSSGPKLGTDAKIDGSKHSGILYSAIGLTRPFDLVRDSLNKAYNAIQNQPGNDSLVAVIIAAFNRNDSLQKNQLFRLLLNSGGSMATLFFQDRFDVSKDFVMADQLEKAMYAANPGNEFVKEYHAELEKERRTAVGSPAPDITLPDKDGVNRSLSSLKGKVVLLDFWASWCGPCRRENPNVVRLYKQYHDKGFEVFSVSLDKDRAAWLKGITDDGLAWPDHVSDLKYWKSAGAAVYGVTAIPYTVLIDREGNIAAKKIRGEDLARKLKEMLQ